MSGHMDFDRELVDRNMDDALEEMYTELDALEQGISIAETQEVHQDLTAKYKEVKKNIASIKKEYEHVTNSP